MGRKENITIAENGMLTNEAMIAFLEGRLSPTQNAEIEKIMADDPFAAEALEGLKAQNIPSATVNSTLTHINQKIKDKSGVKKKQNPALKFQWINYAFAASVIGILLAVGIWFVTYLSTADKQMAKNETTLPNNNENTIATTAVESETADTSALIVTEAAAPITTQPNSTLTADDISITPNNIGTAAKPTLANAETNGYKTTEVSPNATMEGVAAAPTTFKKVEERKVAEIAANTADASLAKEKIINQNSLQSATAAYNRGDYKNAQTYYAEAVKENPSNVDAIFYGGVSSYINGDMRNAEQNFDILLKKKAYKDGANWYKANILIKKGETGKAKEILRELTNTNGYYKERAIKLYEDIK